MKNPYSYLTLALVLSTPLAACSGGDATDAEPGTSKSAEDGGNGTSTGGSSNSIESENIPDSLSLRELIERLPPIVCEKLKCTPFMNLSDEECVPWAAQIYNSAVVDAMEHAVDTTDLQYDPTAGAECLKDYASMDCSDYGLGDPFSCEGVLSGASEGDECVAFECGTSELYCNLNDTCPGTCERRAEAGAACTDTEQCQLGMRCMDEVCTELGEEGEACDTFSQPCQPSTLCAGDPAVCTTPETTPWKKLGEECSPFGPAFCERGLSCGFESGTCFEPGGAGAPCELGMPASCDSGFFCPEKEEGSETAFCAPRVEQGEACPRGNECDIFDVCVGGTCKGLGEEGEACEDDMQCTTQICRDGVCGSLLECE